MKKQINVCSVGQIWPDEYPACPPEDTLQVVLDIRSVVADPLESIGPIDGTEIACQNHIMAAPGYTDWLMRTAFWLDESYLKPFNVDDKFLNLNIIFVCAGGFQRSVCTAIKVAEKLRQFSPGLDINVEHWTMGMTRRKAEAKAREQQRD